MREANLDPFTNEIGKTLFLCFTKHANKITNILNELAHKKFSGQYQSDFAVQVTSNIENAQQMTTNFTNNNLNGNSNLTFIIKLLKQEFALL